MLEPVDFRFGSGAPEELAGEFLEASRETAGAYQALVEGVSRKNMDNPDWWVSGPASRNTWASPLFHNLCVLRLLQRLGGRLDGRELIVDGPAMRRAVLSLLPGAAVRVRRPFLWRLKEFANKGHAYFSAVARIVCARLSGKKGDVSGVRNLILVDTFVMPGFVDKDRYYTGLSEALPEDVRGRLFFAPTWINFKASNGVSLYRSLRNSTRKFIIKEDYLGIWDLLHVFLHPLRARRVAIGRPEFAGVDVSGLFLEDMRRAGHLWSAFEGLMNMRFARRLAEAGVDARVIVDWNEGQAVDKGWNLGFNKFFPKAVTKGYQGYFITDFYFCRFPTEAEREAGAAPRRIAVTGAGLVPHVKRFCAALEVETAPAFRYGHVHEGRRVSGEARAGYTIFAALPVMTEESLDILGMLDGALLRDARLRDARVIYKTHPGSNAEKIVGGFRKTCPNEFERVEGGFGECLERCDLYAGAASGTCLEALARGWPVVVLDRHGGMTCPIPENMDKNSWKLCGGTEKLVEAVLYFKSSGKEGEERLAAAGEAIRRDYFEKVAPEAARKFLES